MTDELNPSVSALPDRMVSIAREIAMDLHELDEVLRRYSLTPGEFKSMSEDPRFHAVLDAAVGEWNAAKNTADRIKMKAGISLEESIVNLHAAMNNVNEPLNHRVEVAKLMAKLAGVGEAAAGPSGPGFSLTINMGEAQPHVVKIRDITPVIEG